MEYDLEYLNKLKGKQSDIQIKLDQLELAHVEGEKLEKNNQEAQDRLKLLRSDVVKDEQDVWNQQINVSFKDVRLSAFESVMRETKEEITKQNSALQNNKAQIETEKARRAETLVQLNELHRYSDVKDKIKKTQDKINGDIAQVTEKLSQLSNLQGRLSSGVKSIDKLEAKIADRKENENILAADLAKREVDVQNQRREILSLIEQRNDLVNDQGTEVEEPKKPEVDNRSELRRMVKHPSEGQIEIKRVKLSPQPKKSKSTSGEKSGDFAPAAKFL